MLVAERRRCPAPRRKSSRASRRRWRRPAGNSKSARAGVVFLLRLPQRRLRRREIRTVDERCADQGVERLRPEQRPPVGGQVAPGQDPLRFAAGRAGRRHRLGRQRRLRIRPGRRCGRLAEVGTDRAPGQHCAGEKAGGTCAPHLFHVVALLRLSTNGTNDPHSLAGHLDAKATAPTLSETAMRIKW